MDRDERNRVRAERYRELSEKSAEKARSAYERSTKMGEAIPFGNQYMARQTDDTVRKYGTPWDSL